MKNIYCKLLITNIDTCPLHTTEDTPKAARRVLPAVYVVASKVQTNVNGGGGGKHLIYSELRCL